MSYSSNLTTSLKEEKLNRNLFHISLAAMVVILTLLITKVSTCLNEVEEIYSMKSLCAITVASIMIILVDIIYTMVYAHSHKNLAFHPIYFIFSILLILLPLYVSSDLITSYISETSSNENIEDKSRLLKGILSLLICFISLVIYTRILTWKRETSGMKKTQFLLVTIFHLSGIGYCLFFIYCIKKFIHPEEILFIPSIIVYGGSIIYLILAYSSEFIIRIRI